MADSIHSVRYASQPYVTFDCTNEEHYVKAGVGELLQLPASVFCTGDGGLYAFEPELVTCAACLALLEKGGPDEG